METKNFMMTLELKIIGKLKHLARRKSLNERKDITFQQLIRECIYEKYGDRKQKSQTAAGRATEKDS